jgi:hypothetical protein
VATTLATCNSSVFGSLVFNKDSKEIEEISTIELLLLDKLYHSQKPSVSFVLFYPNFKAAKLFASEVVPKALGGGSIVRFG